MNEYRQKTRRPSLPDWKIWFLLLCVSIWTTGACSSPRLVPQGTTRLLITLPKEFPADLGRLSSLILKKLSLEIIPGDCVVELVFYDYSSGKEVFTISDEKPMSVDKNSFNPRIGMLVKIKKGGSLVHTEFLEISAKDKDQAVDTAVREIAKSIRSAR